MAQGLQVLREDGTVSLDIRDRIPKFLGIAAIDGSAQSGTIQNDEINYGDIWYMFLTLSYPDPSYKKGNNKTWETPTITKGDKCLNWSFPTNRHVSCQILYGAY